MVKQTQEGSDNMKNEETSKRLRIAMDKKMITAKQLSEKSGVSEPSISQYLHGTFAPKNITAAKLAKVLDVNPMWIMGFDVNKNPKDDVEKFLETSKEYTQITELIQKLNSDGLQKLIERAEELTELPRYRKDN
jgi:transcriptional regulator with XRE-family HTH domain